MKTIENNIILFTVALTMISTFANAQINWNNVQPENKHLINVNAGVESGLTYGFGYGHRINHKLFPAVVNIEYTSLAGNKTFDDYKVKMGLHINWFEKNNFKLNTKIQGVFRRNENDFVRLLNFGSDMSATIGYFKTKWFAAGEFGFDKAIITHFKHSEKYKDNFSEVIDGWYEPSTGGNFYYGLQGGYSINKYDIYLRAGKFIQQDLKTKPLIPYYGQVGMNFKF